MAAAATGSMAAALLLPRLLRQVNDRPAIFAAQFTLSHLCWLIAYPTAGWLVSRFGLIPALTFLPLAALRASGTRCANGRRTTPDLSRTPTRTCRRITRILQAPSLMPTPW